MDINLAKSLLEAKVKQMTDELAVLVMANEIINETFKADFTSLETAQSEANQLAVEKSEAINEKNLAVAEVQTLKQALVDANTEKAELQATIVTKEAEIVQLKKDSGIVAPVEEVVV